MMEEVNLDEVTLSSSAAAAWYEMAECVAIVFQRMGKARAKNLSIPDERVRVNGDGTLTIFVDIPDVIDVSMDVPVGHWGYRQ
jgi:hypothetical protein